MNQHIDDPIPPFDDPAHEREWLVQERAMRRERLQLDPAGDDARGRRYRLLARALREPLPDALPADFAQQLARCVAAVPTRRAASGTAFEFALTLALAAALAVAAGVVVAMYGSAWLPSFVTILPTPHAPTTRWLLALAGCLGASWLLGQWQRHAQERAN
ncbi:hypothetical protein [Rhodanobacter thiooxydans]|uniref:hypothetical protein n=1 Tax=Rhodanobacter thiooxydans TaxID=416169 RepID=UPI000D3A36B3|nr:hypothetical protein [Rhodanobacter thiooxydans]